MSKKPSTSPEKDLGDQIENYLQGSSEEEVASLDFDVDVEPPVEDPDFIATMEDGEVLDDSEFDLADAPDDKLIEEFDLDLAGMAGEVMEFRSLQGNILAKVKVEDNNLGISAGVYLVLKIKGKEILIYGGEHADKLDEGTIDMIYRDVDSVDKFLKKSAEFKGEIDKDQQNKLDKFKKEIGTISGIILKYRFLQGNLLSLIKIDQAMHEAAFEEKTDPKLLQMGLIERGEKIDCVEELRDGIYAIFIYGETRTILGGDKNAHKLKPEEVKTIFEKSKKPTDFFNENVRVKKKLKAKKDLKELEAGEEIAEKERKLEQILAELDEPITEEGEASDISEDIDEEELDKLTAEIDELVNGEDND